MGRVTGSLDGKLLRGIGLGIAVGGFLRKWLGGILAENGLGRARMANQGKAKGEEGS